MNYDLRVPATLFLTLTSSLLSLSLSTSRLALLDNVYRHKNRRNAAAVRSLIHLLLAFPFFTYSVHFSSPSPPSSP